MQQAHRQPVTLLAALRPPADAKALIFDCDGTLALTAEAHFGALTAAFSQSGLEFGRSWYAARLGLSLNELVAEHQNEFAHEHSVGSVRASHHQSFPDQIGLVSPFEAVVDIVREYHGKLPLAVASGADEKILRMVLDHLGILSMFDSVIGIGKFKIGKPAPDLFLEMARRLKLDPSECFVYEDSFEGMEAAKAARMAFIDVSPFRAAWI